MIAVLVVAAGCGTPAFDDLAEPAVWWQESNQLCAVDRAVDGERLVWKSQGCELDARFLNIGSTTPEKFARVMTAADLLPRPPPPPPSCGAGLRHLFQLRRQGEHLRWLACGRAGAKLGDLAGLEEPYLSVATALRDLP
jgi:hypothetical protein